MKNTITKHRVEEARFCASPNFNDRCDLEKLRLIVFHCICLPPGEYKDNFIDDFFLNRLDPDQHAYFAEISHMEVSSHFLIRRDGELVQYVDCDKRAWHAGESTYEGSMDCNEFSIGIEFEGSEDEAFESIQYQVAGSLVAALCQEYSGLTRERMVGHSDIAPGRKTDPGSHFDWKKLMYEVIRAEKGE